MTEPTGLHQDPFALTRPSRARIAWLAAPRPWLLALLLGLLVVALYAPFINNPLVFDDRLGLTPTALAQYRDWSSLWRLRGLPYASFAWSAAWIEPPLHIWRAGNILLHCANVVILMFFLRRLYCMALPTASRPRLAWLAFWAALLFALHPVAVFAVGYLNERSILMATGFSLLVWWAWLEGVATGRRLPIYAACGFYLLAVLSKEHAVMAAPVAVLLTFLCRPARLPARQFVLPLLLLLAIGAMTVWQVQQGSHLIGQPYEPRGPELLAATAESHSGFNRHHAFGLSIMTQANLYFKYLSLWLLPVPAWMSVDMYEPFATHFLDPSFVLGLLAYLAYVVAAVWLLPQRGRKGLLGFALLCPWLLFMTEFSTVRVSETFVLYRSYLWMPGLLAALPVVFGRLPGRWIGIGLLASLLALLPLSLLRLEIFSDPILLWDDAASLVGNGPYRSGVERIFMNRGNAWAEFGEMRHARQDYATALRINPHNGPAHFNLGLLLYNQGKWAAAMTEFSRSIADYPAGAKAYLFRGRVWAHLNQPAKALQDIGQAIAHYPQYAEAYLARGQVRAQQGENAPALQDIRQALALDPGLQAARLQVAQLEEKLGQRQAAAQDYARACAEKLKVACQAATRLAR